MNKGVSGKLKEFFHNIVPVVRLVLNDITIKDFHWLAVLLVVRDVLW